MTTVAIFTVTVWTVSQGSSKQLLLELTACIGKVTQQTTQITLGKVHNFCDALYAYEKIHYFSENFTKVLQHSNSHFGSEWFKTGSKIFTNTGSDQKTRIRNRIRNPGWECPMCRKYLPGLESGHQVELKPFQNSYRMPLRFCIFLYSELSIKN